MANTSDTKIYLAVKAILDASTLMATGGGYIKNNLKGATTAITENSFPCTVLEPDYVEEETITNTRKKLLKVGITIACFMECTDFDKQIVGGTNVDLTVVRGIMDFANDVKNELDKWPTLDYDSTGKRCNFFRFGRVDFSKELFPFRVAEIPLIATILTDGASLR
jgi:hypothetical protein